jgi:hypothetical protein
MRLSVVGPDMSKRVLLHAMRCGLRLHKDECHDREKLTLNLLGPLARTNLKRCFGRRIRLSTSEQGAQFNKLFLGEHLLCVLCQHIKLSIIQQYIFGESNMIHDLQYHPAGTKVLLIVRNRMITLDKIGK